MTPSNLKSLLSSCFCVALLLITSFSKAQSGDTIVIYDYLWMVDTIWIEQNQNGTGMSTTIHNALLPLKPSENLLISPFPSEKSATLSENSIIVGENKKQDVMKRKGLFTMLLLPLHFATFGQKEFNIHAGASGMWIEHHTSTVSNPTWGGANLGVEFLRPLGKGKVALSYGVTARYIEPTHSYKQKKAVDASLSELEYEFATVATNVIMNELNVGLFTKPYWQASIPLKINFNLTQWEPFVGVEYSFTYSLYRVLEGELKPTESTFNNVSFHDLEILLGTNYRLSDHWAIRIQGSNGLFGKCNRFNWGIYPNLGNQEYYFTSFNLDMSIVYTCHSNHKK